MSLAAFGMRRYPLSKPNRVSTVLRLLVAVTVAGRVMADGLAYRVEINAPSALEALLRQNLGVVRWQGSEYLDREQLDRLFDGTQKEVENLLAPQGYFQPKISTALKVDQTPLVVTIDVVPGKQTEVSDVELQLTGAIRLEPDFQSRYAELLQVWPLPMGGAFTQVDWDAAKRRGLQAVMIDRFPAATINASRANIDPDKAQAELTVEYQSGPRFSFGPLTVRGLRQFPRSVVDRLLTFQPGEGYSQQKLLDFQTALQNTPYFASVFIDMPLDPAKPVGAPVQLDIQEAPRFKADIGLGYETDKGPRTSFAFRDANVQQRGWIGTVGTSLQKSEQSFTLGVELPPDDDGYRYANNLLAKHQDIAGLRSLSQTLGVQRTRQKTAIEVTQAIQFTRANEQLDGEAEKRNYALIFSQSWTRTRLDNVSDPRRGLMLSWQLGGAAKALLSSSNFVRAWGRAAWYQPINDESLLLLRAEAGQVVSDTSDNVPSDWLFRAGGAGSVRGYGYHSLGIKNAAGAVEGGRVMTTLSAEYQHKLVGKWRAAVFADVGGVANDWLSFKAYKGYGVGARWVSPVGPFAFDTAYGADDHRVRLHLSLGVGF